MRINLPAAIAAVVLSCGLSAPAQAAQSFSFSYGNPLTLTTQADYFGADYRVQQYDTREPQTFADAAYSLSISFVSSESNKNVPTYSFERTVQYGAPQSESIYGVSDGITVPFFLTFTSLTPGKSFDLYDVNAYLIRHGSPSFITFDVVPSVPEPSTWLMMIGGFAMIGSAARSRVRQEVIRA
jgi:hypothetical protein